jgi:hypothetical protein
MDYYVCGQCGAPITAIELNNGSAVCIEGIYFCARCKPVLKGWLIDLPAIYGKSGWSDRAGLHLAEHLMEPPGQHVLATCVMLYHIGEIGVSKEAGKLAVYRNKHNPKLLFNGRRALFWYFGDDSIQWSQDGGLAFLYECTIERGLFDLNPRSFGVRLYILDFIQERWCRGRKLDDFYRLEHVGAGRYRLKSPSDISKMEAEILDITRLDWRPFRV